MTYDIRFQVADVGEDVGTGIKTVMLRAAPSWPGGPTDTTIWVGDQDEYVVGQYVMLQYEMANLYALPPLWLPLQYELEACVEAERYEEAAALRDGIKRMKEIYEELDRE